MIYFQQASGKGLLATYVVVPPIVIDFGKYLPPMFAAQGMVDNLAQASSVVPLPPVPEAVSDLNALRGLAEERDDDLVCGGEASSEQVERLLMCTSEAAQLYFHLYQDAARGFPDLTAASEPKESLEGPSPQELTFALMGERERLGELAKLAGALRYAVEGSDSHLETETVEQMKLLVKHLPAKYWPEKIIDAAGEHGAGGARLSQLYIERCYKLNDEDYEAVQRLEREIEAVKAS